MSERPPPLSKSEENLREEILDRIKEGWPGQEWAIIIPPIVNEMLRQNLLTTRTPLVTRTDRAADGIQWISMEELGKALTDRCQSVRKLKETRRKIHPEVEEYMRRYVTDKKDWEQVDDEDFWGVDYTEPTTEIKDKIESILLSWGGEHPEEKQTEEKQPKLERERFSVPHASRDPETLKDRNMESEEIFEVIRTPTEVGVVRIFGKPECWDTTIGSIKVVTTQGITTIQLPSGPLSLDGAQWHLLKHTLDNSEPSALHQEITLVHICRIRMCLYVIKSLNDIYMSNNF